MQMIPVILIEADVPGFAKSRNWIDFRNESKYSENIWRLVWGILGHKPAKVLDLAAPTHQPAVDRPDTAGDAKAPVRSGKYSGSISGGGSEPADMRGSKNAVVFNQKDQKVGTQTNIGKMSGGFVNTGMTVHGNVQQAGRDIRMGDQYEAGRDIHQESQALSKLFEKVLERVAQLSEEDRRVVKPVVESVRDQVTEIQQSGIEDESAPQYGKLKRGLKTLVEWVPDIADVVLAFLQNPVTGIVKGVRKVAEKIKSEMK